MNEDTATVEIVRGGVGACICINDYRICGDKPWGGGAITYTRTAQVKDIRHAIGADKGCAVCALGIDSVRVKHTTITETVKEPRYCPYCGKQL